MNFTKVSDGGLKSLWSKDIKESNPDRISKLFPRRKILSGFNLLNQERRQTQQCSAKLQRSCDQSYLLNMENSILNQRI